MKNILGICSKCGGNVTCPTVYHSVVPPVPSCERCGARPKGSSRVIEMEDNIPPGWQFLSEQG